VLLDLVKYGLGGEARAIQHISRRLLRAPGERSDVFRRELGRLLVAESGSPMRSAADVALPVEPETQQPLANLQQGLAGEQPILAPPAAEAIERLIAARLQASALIEAGIEPPRTLLLTGPPGVGKSMTAAALAARLELPLIGVELAALMSSFLGKTGQNLARLLEHARGVSCVLFLDEFDAVAKRRDDLTEIGELKRLVNMLLLELDRWPSTGLLIAATNHPQLLDPAVERRFDVIVDLPKPGFEERRAILARAFDRLAVAGAPSETMVAAAALALEELSGAELERLVAQVARDSVLGGEPIAAALERLAFDPLRSKGRSDRLRRAAFAGLAAERGMTQREIAELLDISHPTVGALVAEWRETVEGEAGPRRQRQAGAKEAPTKRKVATRKKSKSSTSKKRSGGKR